MPPARGVAPRGECSTWRPLLAKLSASECCSGPSLGVRTLSWAGRDCRGTKVPLGLLPYSDPSESATGDVPSVAAIVRGAADLQRTHACVGGHA